MASSRSRVDCQTVLVVFVCSLIERNDACSEWGRESFLSSLINHLWQYSPTQEQPNRYTNTWRLDDAIKWKHFPRHWPFVQGTHPSSVNSPHKGQWCGALMFSLICVWTNGCTNNRNAGNLRQHRAHYDVTVKLATTGTHYNPLCVIFQQMSLCPWLRQN